MSEPNENVDPETGEYLGDDEGAEFEDGAAQSRLSAIIKVLDEQSLNPRLWKQLPNSDQSPYMPWIGISWLLDKHAPGWTHTTTRADVKNGLAIMTVAIEIEGTARESTAAEAFKGVVKNGPNKGKEYDCLLYTSPSPRDS